jgi:hypothetical protein
VRSKYKIWNQIYRKMGERSTTTGEDSDGK